MSAEAWAGVAAFVALALGTWWALGRGQVERPSSSNVDPDTVPVGAYWWEIEQRGVLTWRWRLYRRAMHTNVDTMYSIPVGTTASSNLTHTRGAAVRAVRRAVHRDVTARRYAAEVQRGTVDPPPLSRGYRGRDVGPHGKPPTTPAAEAGIVALAKRAGLTADQAEASVEAFTRGAALGQWPGNEPPCGAADRVE